MKLRSARCDVGELSRGDRDAMFQLMERTYANMRRDRFEADLNAKQWVILVHCQDSPRVVGFTTQVLLEAGVGEEPVRALYSGDTVMDREHWGDPALAHAWGNFALELIDQLPKPLFWFLTSKGFRTYRYLPLFFRHYFPRPESLTPAWERSVMDAFGQRLGGKWYDPSRQIVRAAAGKDHVRREIGEPGLRPATDEHVRFFIDRNPEFAGGDELCCLAPLTCENFTGAAWRVMGRTPSRVSSV